MRFKKKRSSLKSEFQDHLDRLEKIMLDIKKLSDEELKTYLNACIKALSSKPYAYMAADELEKEEPYIAAMCMQEEFTERELGLPR